MTNIEYLKQLNEKGYKQIPADVLTIEDLLDIIAKLDEYRAAEGQAVIESVDAPPETCIDCGEVKPARGKSEDGLPVCKDCAGNVDAYIPTPDEVAADDDYADLLNTMESARY